MPLVWLCQVFGWLLARAPRRCVEFFCRGLGWLIYHLPLSRVRLLKSNLHHAFPAAKQRLIGVQACQRLVEMATFGLASPFLSAECLRRLFSIQAGDRDRLHLAMNGERPALFLLPHVTLFEAMGALPLLEPNARGHGAVFRPLRQSALSDWVTRTRERWGAEMLSRRDGVNPLNQKLREKRSVTILFDQHVGKRGQLIFFMDRVAAATHLPGLLAKRFGADAYFLLPSRRAFWSAEIACRPLAQGLQPIDLSVAAHRELERYLRESPEASVDWLWFHGRWNTLDDPRRRFHIRKSSDYLRESLPSGVAAYPRQLRLWIRMPNWLGDNIMAIPLIRALRKGRPDAHIRLIAPEGQRPLLETLDVDHVASLPSGGSIGRFAAFRRMAREFPDVLINLTNSQRGDIEAWLTRAPQRFGMRRPGRPRPLLSHAWKLPENLDETREHQLSVWEQMLRYFGLEEELDRAPLVEQRDAKPCIGLICGTENTPSKRWPVARWREFIELRPEQSFLLFGTSRDKAITEAVCQGFLPDRVKDLAGTTDLTAFIAELRRCLAVVCNDTGGMHLASYLGVPLVAIFGPTNPIRTGPIFETPCRILQPPDCPPTGGGAMEDVTAERVSEALSELISRER